jgi:hypothetical protein
MAHFRLWIFGYRLSLEIGIRNIVWSLGFGIWDFRDLYGRGGLNILCPAASKIAKTGR